MNFFEQQTRARRKSATLAVLFGIAVLGIVCAVYVAVRFAMQYAELHDGQEMRTADFVFWDSGVFVSVAVVVIVFIAVASAFKIASLRRGGSAVAEMLGGRLVARDTRDPAERRLLNVVDEMAIASGVPVPQVYLLEREGGINAFAAGHRPSDAAIAVTRGTLRLLDRDELQGVVGHEFSHVLNGDMRLNIQLIGIIFGILAIGIFGRILARSGGRGRRSGGAIALAGVFLILIGYIGTLVGRLIQAAVSRQREFLADSSAVQFTRNPLGIGGALKKIGGYALGSRIETPKADQARHIFFSPGRALGFFGGLLATHPPLLERIQRIDPSFDGRFPRIEARLSDEEAARWSRLDEAPAAGALGAAAATRESAQKTAAELGRDPSRILHQVGRLNDATLLASEALLSELSPAVREAGSSPERASFVMLALLLAGDERERERQWAALKPIMPPKDIALLAATYPLVGGLPRRSRLPLVDLALPALKQLPATEIDRFLGRVQMLIRVDESLTLFEFSLHWLLSWRLVRERRRPKLVAYSSLSHLRREVTTVLAALAYAEWRPREPGESGEAGAAAGPGAAQAFRAGVERIPEIRGATVPPAASHAPSPCPAGGDRMPYLA